jgi:FkbM family methyltransferase
MATDVHSIAVERFTNGHPAEAIDLLRGAVADALDADVVNDLAVMLAQSGETEAARDILAGLSRLAPEHDDARRNLADLAPNGAPRANMDEARVEFLGLVAEAARTHLPDNLDHFFWPWGQPLPEPAETGTRLAAELDVLARSDVFWHGAGDEESRALYLRFLAYRALGPAHVRLQLEPGPYRQAIQQMSAKCVGQAGVLLAPGAPFEWQFHGYDLAPVGFPVKLFGQPLPLASTFLFSQYAYRDSAVPARPAKGAVALDVGGCWGESALWMAHTVGSTGHVHTFEPVPQNRALLERNLALNPDLASRVTVSPAPLSASPGESVVIRDRMAAGARIKDELDGDDVVELRTETIDALVADGSIPRVDFIKVDVEGADLSVLEGAAEAIRAQRPRIAIACYHKPDDLVAIPDLLASLGVPYRWYLQCSTMTPIDTVAFAVPEL